MKGSKIYIITAIYYHDSEDIIGVFQSKKDAVNKLNDEDFKRQFHCDEFEIYEHEIL